MTESANSSSIPLIVRKNVSCTFEASSAWRKILGQFPLKERFLDGNGFRLYFWTHPLYKVAISTPFRDRLALVWDGEKPPLDFDFNSLVKSTGCDDLLLKDVGPFLSNTPSMQPRIMNNYINCEVCLDKDIEKRLRHKGRRNIRKACEIYDLNLEINPEGIFEEFYKMHLSTRHRLGVLPYPKSFFTELFELRNDTVVIFMCRSPQGSLGFLLCYIHGIEMISGHMVYIFEQRHQRICDFLYLSAFQWGRANGFSTFRFGADNRNQVSLIKSKEKLGATHREQWDFQLKQKLNSGNQPNSLPRRLLRSTPNSIFRHMGHLTKMYFG